MFRKWYALILVAGMCTFPVERSAAGTFAVLQRFDDVNVTGSSASGLVGVDDTLIVSYAYGGAQGYGTILSLDLASNTPSLVYTFTDRRDGAYPAGFAKSDGHAFGVTTFGGADLNGAGPGTLFKVFSDQRLVATPARFRHGSGLGEGQAPVYAAGALYGNASPGASQAVYRYDLTSHALRLIAAADGRSTGSKYGRLIKAGDALYGMTTLSNGAVALFRFDLASEQFTTVHVYGQTALDFPVTLMTSDGLGALYGIQKTSAGRRADVRIVSIDVATGASRAVLPSDTLNSVYTLAWAPGRLYVAAAVGYNALFAVNLDTGQLSKLTKLVFGDSHTFEENTPSSLIVRDNTVFGTASYNDGTTPKEAVFEYLR